MNNSDKPIMYFCTNDGDFWLIRNFLREVFMINQRLEHSWSVMRYDYMRWHMIETCRLFESLEKVTVFWKTSDDRIVAVLHPICQAEIRLHIHPYFRTKELENEMITYAEEHFSGTNEEGNRILIIPVFSDDTLRQEILTKRGYSMQSGGGYHRYQNLDNLLPIVMPSPGFEIRSMGTENEYPSRSLASWRAFHSDEPASNYDHDFSWYKNIQTAPLYRRDLDLVAVHNNEIVSFCTIFYDDYSRSAVTVMVGTVSEFWRMGLAKAVIIEGMHRLKSVGCTRVFATATEEPANALYASVMNELKVTDTWYKEL